MDQLNLRDKALIKLLSKDNNGGATMMKRYALVVVLVPVLLFAALHPVWAQGKSTPSSLGIVALPIPHFLHEDGVLVLGVIPDSAAAHAGLRPLDVITAVDGQSVDGKNFTTELEKHAESNAIILSIRRQHRTEELSLSLGEQSKSSLRLDTAFAGRSISYDSRDQAWTIQSLPENDPLYQAGLRAGDKIIRMNDEALTPDQIHSFLMDHVGTTVSVTVERDGQESSFDVPVDALQSLDMFNFFNFQQLIPQLNFLTPAPTFGANVRTGDEGVVVTRITPESTASRAGLMAGDVILKANGQAVTTQQDLDNLLSSDTIQLDVKRGMLEMQLAVSPVQSQPDVSHQMHGQVM
jgi:S1-C subfamily serine protease